MQDGLHWQVYMVASLDMLLRGVRTQRVWHQRQFAASSKTRHATTRLPHRAGCVFFACAVTVSGCNDPATVVAVLLRSPLHSNSWKQGLRYPNKSNCSVLYAEAFTLVDVPGLLFVLLRFAPLFRGKRGDALPLVDGECYQLRRSVLCFQCTGLPAQHLRLSFLAFRNAHELDGSSEILG